MTDIANDLLEDVQNIHDKLFKYIFSNPDNTRDFLRGVLPAAIGSRFDFENLEIDLTNYVSDHFKESFADVVARSVLHVDEADETGKRTERPIDIYIVFEHKSYFAAYTLLQLLTYMVVMWQKDAQAEKPLRLIIPLVFYHGKEEWKLPDTFGGQFNVDDEIKKYLPDFRYLMFNTRPWDFNAQGNEAFGENVFLMTALALMKNAFNDDMEGVVEIFRLWHEKGFVRIQEKMAMFMVYISQTKDITWKKINKILEESKIDGGEVMPTLAQRLMDKGARIGEKRGIQIGEKKGIQIGEKRGEMEGIKKTAIRMLNQGFSVEDISKCTDLKPEEIKQLMH